MKTTLNGLIALAFVMVSASAAAAQLRPLEHPVHDDVFELVAAYERGDINDGEAAALVSALALQETRYCHTASGVPYCDAMRFLDHGNFGVLDSNWGWLGVVSRWIFISEIEIVRMCVTPSGEFRAMRIVGDQNGYIPNMIIEEFPDLISIINNNYEYNFEDRDRENSLSGPNDASQLEIYGISPTSNRLDIMPIFGLIPERDLIIIGDSVRFNTVEGSPYQLSFDYRGRHLFQIACLEHESYQPNNIIN